MWCAVPQSIGDFHGIQRKFQIVFFRKAMAQPMDEGGVFPVIAGQITVIVLERMGGGRLDTEKFAFVVDKQSSRSIGTAAWNDTFQYQCPVPGKQSEPLAAEPGGW